MAYKDDLRISTVAARLKETGTAIIDAIDAGTRLSTELLDAQGSDSILEFSRRLYGLADTGESTLTVDATLKKISCLAGANLFSGFRVGRNVQLTNFTNAGNNQTEEVKEVSADYIIFVDTSTGWVNETDTDARAQEDPTQPEQDVVSAVAATRQDMAELQDALDNAAVATSNRRAVLMDWIW